MLLRNFLRRLSDLDSRAPMGRMLMSSATGERVTPAGTRPWTLMRRPKDHDPPILAGLSIRGLAIS